MRLFFFPFRFSYLRLFLQYYYSSSSSCSFCCFISLNFIILQRFIRLGIGMSSYIIETSITRYVYKLWHLSRPVWTMRGFFSPASSDLPPLQLLFLTTSFPSDFALKLPTLLAFFFSSFCFGQICYSGILLLYCFSFLFYVRFFFFIIIFFYLFVSFSFIISLLFLFFISTKINYVFGFYIWRFFIFFILFVVYHYVLVSMIWCICYY